MSEDSAWAPCSWTLLWSIWRGAHQRVEKSISGVFSFRRLELRRQRLDMCLWHPVTCTARSWLQWLQVFPAPQPEAVADALPEVRSKETFASAETESRAGVHLLTVPHETSRSGGEGCFGCAVWYACNSSQFSTCPYISPFFFGEHRCYRKAK